jgi:DNA polymerase-3 subunit beta
VSSTASDQHLHIGLGATEITTRLVEGQFPDYERIIPRDGATTVIVGTADLLQATRAATVFARDDAHIVRLACTPPPDDGTPALGLLAVTGTSAERGDHAGQLEASVGGAAVQIAFNGRYLRDALEAVGTTQVRLQLSGAQQPGVLRPVGELETAHLHVIMPMLRR